MYHLVVKENMNSVLQPEHFSSEFFFSVASRWLALPGYRTPAPQASLENHLRVLIITGDQDLFGIDPGDVRAWLLLLVLELCFYPLNGTIKINSHVANAVGQ